jgi:NAD-dependent DNA ligase
MSFALKLAAKGIGGPELPKKAKAKGKLAGKTIVVTGTLENFSRQSRQSETLAARQLPASVKIPILY